MNKEEINRKIEMLEKEIAELKNTTKENDELKFERVAEDEPYYYIRLYNCLVIGEEKEGFVPFDNEMFKLNNYFHTKERAEEVAEKIKLLLKLERLHDTFCPDYVPDWSNPDELKAVILYNYFSREWGYEYRISTVDATSVCYPSNGTAKKVCDILNKEGIKP